MNFCSGCNGIAKVGNFCDACAAKQQPAKSKRHPRDAWYLRAAWRGKYGVRLWKLKRNPTCEFVRTDGTVCTNKATQVHHLREEWKENGDWNLFMGGVQGEFLQSLCASCHAAISMQHLMFGNPERKERDNAE